MATRKPRPAPYRLPQNVRPHDYRIHLHVDPASSSRFRGEVEIDVNVAEETREIVLHAADLSLNRASLLVGGGDETLALSVEPPNKHELVRLRCPRKLEKGQYTLRLAFAGALRKDLRGLYGARSGDDRFAFTQLQAADARRVFPCFDEPAFKARFALTVTTGATQTVVSNMAEERVVVSTDRKHKTVEFARTPRLSTYLLALAVGPLKGSRRVQAGPTPIRIFHAPGQEKLTAFGLKVARECLMKLEAYFGVPYPYGKLDLVAVPDFEIGAMENAGAVFFRETLLLLDEKSASLPEKKRAAEVICHELAHMWFGNLVTMAWWDDLWLNEAFATWMAFAIVDELHPEWEMWNDFLHGRNAALDLDALQNTHPIYTEVRTPAEATENFDLITYEKGAAVVRMLERYLGKETFQQGVRSYIQVHREGNAVAADLWRALQRAAGDRSLSRMIRGWIEKPGFPVVKVDREGGNVRLTQVPFKALGPDAAKAGHKDSWTVPWVGRVGGGAGESRMARTLLGGRPTLVEVPIAANFVYGNAEEGGFFRPLHDPQTLAQLGGALPALDSTERMGLISHGFALTHAGYAELSPYLELLWAFGDESNPDVLSALFSPLTEILAACPTEASERALRERIVATFMPSLEAMGLLGKARERERDRLRRAALYDLLARLGQAPELLEDARGRAQGYLDDPATLEANLVSPVVLAAASQGNADLFNAYLKASQQAATPQQRRIFRVALAEFTQPTLVRRLHGLYGKPAVPTQDVAIVAVRQLQNRRAQMETWRYITSRWNTLEKRLTPMLAARLIAGTGTLPPAMAREVVAFYKAHPVPTAQRTLQQLKERFRYKAAFQRRARSPLQALAQPR